MPRIEFDYDDLGQFQPSVQEALLRLEKQQRDRASKEAIPFRGINPDVKSRLSGEEDRNKHTLQRNRHGGINMTDIRGTPPIIPKENQ